ncbi:MAG: hypothetical protein B6245_12080 [Desulfobacteraceae bacterium 4572_88]|nr:MAG: hypothetical protein B6245_12080 [Desulfobacteraceae bacterium 4572_88]
MKTLNFSNLSASDIKSLAKVHEQSISEHEWTRADQISLSDMEQVQVDCVVSRLINYETSLMNEATIWARGIYPLLALAEQGNIRAWAEVPLRAIYPHAELHGIVDGVLGRSAAGMIEAPFLVVVEAKRGLEAKNPRFQLYGEILAAARLNWEDDGQDRQEIFGCYTIGDSWTFIRTLVQNIETDCPDMTIEPSREYAEKIEAETILKILKFIVSSRANRPVGPACL